MMKICGNSLCAWDTDLFMVQKNSQGKVGYATSKVADTSAIHPSKQKKTTETTTTAFPPSRLELNTDVLSAEEESEEDEYFPDLCFNILTEGP